MNQAATIANGASGATKAEKKAAAKSKKELNKQSSSESITNKASAKDETSSKCNGTSTNSLSSTGAITATQKRKDKKLLKAQLAKQSSVEDSSSVESVARSAKAKTKDANPSTCNKTKRNSVDVEPTKVTKDLQLENDAKKEERRKVKAPKYEYADPQYKTNKFDVLDLEDDEDDYYVSEEESIDSGVTSSTVDNPSNQNAKKMPAKANVATKNAKQSNPTPSPSTSSAKAEKSSKQPAKEVLPPPSKKEKSPPAVEAEVPLSKKQKKKLAQQQARQQSQAMAKSEASKGDALSNSMNKLRLNDDTTIELVKENHDTAACNSVSSERVES